MASQSAEIVKVPSVKSGLFKIAAGLLAGASQSACWKSGIVGLFLMKLKLSSGASQSACCCGGRSVSSLADPVKLPPAKVMPLGALIEVTKFASSKTCSFWMFKVLMRFIPVLIQQIYSACIVELATVKKESLLCMPRCC